MGNFKQTTEIKKVGKTTVKVTTDVYNDVGLQADVEVQTGKLCTIDSINTKQFVEELNALIIKFSVE